MQPGIIIGWILFFTGIMRLIVAAINWFSKPYLPASNSMGTSLKVSVLVPVRNEEKKIRMLLEDLLLFRYPDMEVIIYNDCSEDNTENIIKEYIPRMNLKIITGQELPEDWLGKNYACYCLSREATGDVFLFLDADVRVKDGLIESALEYIQKYNLTLLSVFPKQILKNSGSWLTVPLMNLILLSLLPVSLVRTIPFESVTAANGQFLLFTAKTYKELQPHKVCKSEAVEDMAIMKLYKRKGQAAATLLGRKEISCNMYASFREAVNGFAKNVFDFFGGSPFLTVLFAVITTFTPLFLYVLSSFQIFIIYIAIIIFIRIFVSLASKQSIIGNLLLLIPQQFVLWVIIIKAFSGRRKKNLLWKGRNIVKS